MRMTSCISRTATSTLSHDLGRSLVVSQAAEARVPQLAVLRPLGQANFGTQPRLNPVYVTPRQSMGVERAVINFQLRQPLAEALQSCRIETRPDFSCIEQFAGSVVPH